MTATLVSRVAPLLLTTMLVATPVWAQSTTTPGTPPTPTTTPSTDTGQVASPAAPTGTTHKAMPTHSRAAATEQQPGENMEAMVNRRITELHNRLHITSQQDQQWNQFADVMRDNARSIDQDFHQRADKLSSMSAVDNMQSYAQIEQLRAENAQKLVTAFQTVYGTLSDQQKQTADQLFRNVAENARQRHQAAAR